MALKFEKIECYFGETGKSLNIVNFKLLNSLDTKSNLYLVDFSSMAAKSSWIS